MTADDGGVRCGLCPHRCRLAEGATGRCGIRRASGGVLYACGYGKISSAAIDPIEKKPLYHFHPGSRIFSIGGWGCNFACEFCQNWTISQRVESGAGDVDPSGIVADAGSAGSIGVAYTYNEPLVGIEFVQDCAQAVRKAGLKNVLVTNGYIERGPASDLLPLVDALNIDIKSMNEEFYRMHCGGRLAPVLDFAKQAVEAGCHVEITNLLIPGLNSSDDEVHALAEWIAGNLGPGTPLHISAYRPQYKLSIKSTPYSLMESAWKVSRAALSYVYLGNTTGEGQNTVCPGCSATLVTRRGYMTELRGTIDGSCADCGRRVDIAP